MKNLILILALFATSAFGATPTFGPGGQWESPTIIGTLSGNYERIGTTTGGTYDSAIMDTFLTINAEIIGTPTFDTPDGWRFALGLPTFDSQTATVTSGTAAINLAYGNSVNLTVTGTNTVVTFSNPIVGAPYFLHVNTGTFNSPTVTFPTLTTQSLSGTNVYTASGTGTAVVDVLPFIFTSGTTIRILDPSVYYTP